MPDWKGAAAPFAKYAYDFWVTYGSRPSYDRPGYDLAELNRYSCAIETLGGVGEKRL